MRETKIILALLLCLLMVLPLVACGDKPAETTAPETTKEVAETTTVPETTTGKAPETTTAPETTAEQGPHTAHTWAENATYTAYADKAADGSIGYMAIRCTAEGCKAVKNNTYTPVYAYYDFEKVPTAAELPTITVVGSADGVSYVLKEGADSAKNEIEITSAARYFYAASNTSLSDYIKKSGDKFVCRTNVGSVENGVLTPSYNIFDVGTKFLYDPKEVTELTFDVDIEFEKISGSATGGNTLLGLSRRKANADSSPASLILHSRKDASGTVISGEGVLKFSKSETKGLTDELGNEIIIKDGETHHFTLIIDAGKAWTFSVKMDGKLLYRDDESAIAMSTGGANYANGFVLGNAVGTVHMDNIVFAAANAVKNDDLCECGSVAVITTEIPATCTEGGSLTVTCAECGKTSSTTTEALGHEYDVILDPAAVIFPADGEPYVIRACVRCGETLEEKPEQLRHVHYIIKHEAGEATCVAEGYKECYECPVCGKFFSDPDGLTEIAKESVVTPKNPENHIGERVVMNQKAATCTATGNEGDTCCSACGAILEAGTVIPMADHKVSAAWSRDEANHWKTCTVYGCGAVIGTKEAHTYVWVVDRPATEFAGGIQHEQCTGCGAVRNENAVIPQLDHNHSLFHTDAVAATCVTEGNLEYWYCTSCKNYYGDAEATVLLSTPVVPVDYTNHVGATQLEGVKKVSCQRPGYTGDTVCQSCGNIVKKGAEIAQMPHSYSTTQIYTAYDKKAADGAIGDLAYRCVYEGCDACKNNTYTPVYAYYDFEKVPTAAELPTITVVGSADGVSYVLKEGADSTKNEIEITSAARYFYAASNTGLYDYIKKSGDKFVCRTNVGSVENGVLTPNYNIFDVGTKFLFGSKEVTELTFDVDIEFEEISGSATGGNTLLGLSRRKTNADSSPASLILHSRKDASGTVIPGEAVLKFSKSETKGLTDELGNEIIIKDGETHHFTMIIDSGTAWTFSVKMDGKLLYRDGVSAIAMSTGGANYANGFVLGNAVGTVHMDNIILAAANAVKTDDL